jgi:dynein heavy chain
MTEQLHNVVGDVVISSGVVAYNGPFTPTFRADLLAEWQGLKLLQFPAQPEPSVTQNAP